MEVIITGEHQHKTVEEKPDFFAMEWQEGIVLNNEPTPIFIDVETMGNQDVDILVTPGIGQCFIQRIFVLRYVRTANAG